MLLRRIPLLNDLDIKKTIKNFVDTAIDKRLEIIKDEILFLKNEIKVLKETLDKKIKENKELELKIKSAEDSNEKILKDISTLVYAVNSLYYLLTNYDVEIDNKYPDDEDDNNTYH